MIRGAIFDVDGTLLDSMHIWDTIGEEYLRRLGYTPRENLNETFKTMSLYQAALYYRSEYGVPLSPEEIMDGVNAMIEGFYRQEVQPKPGVRDFLQTLSELGVRMSIATATDRPFVEAALVRCGLDRYFSDIFTCTDVGCGKDEPFIYQKALAHMGTRRSDTVIFEDALYAIKTAKEDGFYVAAVYDVHESHPEAVRQLADSYLSDFFHLSSFWKFASAL